jgi:hypothetical protein
VPGHQCYHCKQFVAEGAPHDCWTTTEAALTMELTSDLRDAWERLRESAVELGEQRIYASHNSIMFSRKACHFFVRPKRAFLELTVFLGRAVMAPQIQRVRQSSRTKWTHVIHIRHRDQVEAPLTDWMREAYDLEGAKAATQATAKPVPRAAVKSESGRPSVRKRRKGSASRGKTRAPRTAARRSGRAPRRGRG